VRTSRPPCRTYNILVAEERKVAARCCSVTGAASAVLALLAVAWFGTLGVRPLTRPTRAATPRSGGDGGERRLDHAAPERLKYFEKPPLQYWDHRRLFTLFEVRGLWSAQLWTTLAGFAGIFMVLFGRKASFGAPRGSPRPRARRQPLYVMLGQIKPGQGLTFFSSLAVFALRRAHAPFLARAPSPC